MSRATRGVVDFGRWTVGTWTTETPGIWFAIGYTYRSAERPYGISGPAITIGRRTWAMFTRFSRSEYKARSVDPWKTESEEFPALAPPQRGLARMLWWR